MSFWLSGAIWNRTYTSRNLFVTTAAPYIFVGMSDTDKRGSPWKKLVVYYEDFMLVVCLYRMYLTAHVSDLLQEAYDLQPPSPIPKSRISPCSTQRLFVFVRLNEGQLKQQMPHCHLFWRFLASGFPTVSDMDLSFSGAYQSKEE